MKHYANDQAIAEAHAGTRSYIQRVNVTPLQYKDNLFAKAVCVGDVYVELALNNIFIERT